MKKAEAGMASWNRTAKTRAGYEPVEEGPAEPESKATRPNARPDWSEAVDPGRPAVPAAAEPEEYRGLDGDGDGAVAAMGQLLL